MPRFDIDIKFSIDTDNYAGCVRPDVESVRVLALAMIAGLTDFPTFLMPDPADALTIQVKPALPASPMPLEQ